MQYADETQLRHLRLRVQEELSHARADLESARASLTNEPDLGDRLEQIERELTRLQRSRGLRFRGRRTQAVLGLLLSERLLLDDLGFDSYADYASVGVEGRAPEADGDAAYAGFARLELASAQERLTDIENGVLDLDWIESGRPEVSLFERPDTGAAFSAHHGDPSSRTDAPLEAWRNPFAADADPPPSGDRRSELPHLGRPAPRPADLPHWNEDKSA